MLLCVNDDKKMLFDFIKINNLLGVLSVVYPEESNTSVDGPLTNVTVEEWKAWKEAIGNNGVYGDKFNEISDNDSPSFHWF